METQTSLLSQCMQAGSPKVHYTGTVCNMHSTLGTQHTQAADTALSVGQNGQVFWYVMLNQQASCSCISISVSTY